MRQQNIIMLVADQLRYDCVSPDRMYPVKTPNIDKLASEGVFFEHAFTPMPVCAPARQCLASGRMADSYGAFWNYDMKGLPCKSLTGGGDTWSKNLQKIGYNTAFLGKWHSSESESPSDFVYEHFIGNDVWSKYIEGKYPGKVYSGGFEGCESFLDAEDGHSFFMANKAVDFIENFGGSDSPFFVRLDFNDPHLPCRPSQPYAGMYTKEDAVPWPSFGDSLENKPYIQKQMVQNWGNDGRDWDYWSDIVARYYATITQLDAAVGRILDAVDKAGLYDDTVIILTSDHGDTSGGHGMMDKHYILYDDVCRIPLIIRYPNVCDKGIVSSAFVSNMLDIAPTIEEICYLSPAGERHGQSLLPLLKGEEQPWRDSAVSSGNGQQFGFYSNRSIRTKRWRYVWNLTDVDELYDHDNDPGELLNLSANPEYADVLKELRLALHIKLVAYSDPFAGGWVEKQLTEGKKY